MQRAGFFRIMQPERYGGFELDPEVFFRTQIILAQGCFSLLIIKLLFSHTKKATQFNCTN